MAAGTVLRGAASPAGFARSCIPRVSGQEREQHERGPGVRREAEQWSERVLCVSDQNGLPHVDSDLDTRTAVTAAEGAADPPELCRHRRSHRTGSPTEPTVLGPAHPRAPREGGGGNASNPTRPQLRIGRTSELSTPP